MHLYDLVACRAPRHGSAVRSAAKQPLGGWVLCDGTPVYTTILSLSGFITSEPGGLLRAFLQRRRCAFLKTASVLFQGRRCILARWFGKTAVIAAQLARSASPLYRARIQGLHALKAIMTYYADA